MEKKKSDSQAPDMSACRGCRHFFEAADPDCYRQSIPACEYILDTGRRRPCGAAGGWRECGPAARGLGDYGRRLAPIEQAFIAARRRG